MRVLKVILIIISFFTIGLSLYLFYIDTVAERSYETHVSYEKYIHIAIIGFSAVLNILYHIKSFRFYKRKEKQQLDKKLPKIFWIGAICFSAYLLYVSGTTMYTFILLFKYSLLSQYVYVILIFLVPGLLGFLEISILKKRIKRLKATLEAKDEINTIGNSTL